MKNPKFKVAGTIKRVVDHTGWDGGANTRLDLVVGGVSVHLYVPAIHPLGKLCVGDRIEMTAIK